ncbi:MAG TPA: enoyl-CoA hydratase/isomerase family protein [Candidatus Acidoferrales bacterium]|nr:enoyl-CoA hydratase/isomerase family protein [Candidatus Acidoferrales bacterium]
MKSFQGKTLSWSADAGVIEMKLHREPGNEIGSAMLDELEAFAEAFEDAGKSYGALIIYSGLAAGFSAGADLRELYERSQGLSAGERIAGVRDFLLRIHRVLNTIDGTPVTTIAAPHGVTFGGGLELALACDLIIADKSARFCFPELRLGLIPGFGGIPRLRRDIGNAVIRDMLLTGRSFNAVKAQAAGLVSQVTAEGEALAVARMTAAQICKFDRDTTVAAKRFIKPIPYEELRREIDVFCQLFSRPAVEEGLRKFVTSADAMPYLP